MPRIVAKDGVIRYKVYTGAGVKVDSRALVTPNVVVEGGAPVLHDSKDTSGEPTPSG